MEVGDLIRDYTIEANLKLDVQFTGSRQAIQQIAEEKAGEFILVGDIGLSIEEKQLLQTFIAGSMMQSFSLGYGIGKVEGQTKKEVYL